MATGYLPVLLLKQNFRAFAMERATRQLTRQYPQIVDFIQYMEDTYVGEQALFQPLVWSVYGRRSDNRSNNWVEGMSLIYFIIINMNDVIRCSCCHHYYILISHSKSPSIIGY